MFEATVYKITNNFDNLTYIGSTTQSLSIRLSKHKSRSRTYQNKLYRHCTFVGWENVEIEEILSTDVYSTEQLRDYEQYYINLLKPDLNSNRAVKLA